jgi:uncharacterized protein
MPQGVDPQSAPAPRAELGHLDLSRIAQDLQIRKVQVEAVVQLLDEGNTIPFITRYRKERTGGLDEEALRIIQERVGLLRQLAERKQTILRSIDGQGKLTDELRAAILSADNPKRLEDLYLPYKPKKRSLAAAAREKGLDKLAQAIWEADAIVANLAEVLPTLVNPEQNLNTPDDVLLGAQHILAETIAECADVRAIVRAVLWDTGKLCTVKSEKLQEGQGLEYKDYFNFQEPIRQIPPHRILAINRGEKDSALSIKLEWDAATGRRVALERLPLPQKAEPTPASAGSPAPAAPTDGVQVEASILPDTPGADHQALAQPSSSPAVTDPGAQTPPSSPTPGANAPGSPPPGPPPPGPPRHSERHSHRGHRGHHPPPPNRMEDLQKHPHREFIEKVTDDALARLLVPSLEREIRRELTQKAEHHAVGVFARNLRSKLLAAPLRGKRVLAIDPAFRTGCKLAALDEMGNLLADAIIHPHPPQNKKAEAKTRLEEMVRRHQVQVIAIGNGTACRETEEFVSDLLSEFEARRTNPTPPPAPSTEPTADLSAQTSAPAEPAASVAATPEPTPAPAPAESPPLAAVAEATPPAPPVEQPVPSAVAPEAPPPIPVVAEALPPTAESVTPAASPQALSPEVAAPAEAAPGDAPLAQPAAPALAPEAPPAPPPEPLPEPVADLAYVIVNEAGASVYSASAVGREEFPHFDATLRGTISIGRRLQDPLSELVKIDPQHVGVGLYQHDVNPKHLRESLDAVIESCVNTVGVDLNTASVPLLRHVSGLNALVARELVDFRKNHGPFHSREQLLDVPGIGEARFVQAAGFLKINGENPLDGTWIHPESYAVARQLLAEMGYEPSVLKEKERLAELQDKLKTLSPEAVGSRLQVGVPTLRDIVEALARPGRDPREDLPPPVFKKGILKLEDLKPGMELKGTVLNVVDFGAFIDIGLKDSGLVHISQMANRYVKSPYDVVAVGDVVNVWVLSVDGQRHRVSLTMIQPGSERRPPERRGPPPRRDQREGGQREAGPRDQSRREQHGQRDQGQRPQGQGGQPGQGPPGSREARPGGPPRGERRPPREGPPREGGPREGPPRQGGDRSGPPRGRGRTGGLPPRGTSRIGAGNKPPPRRHDEPSAPPPADQAQQPEGQAAPAVPPSKQQPPPPPPRKPKRSPPPPKLSQAALSGKEPLSTFGELAALMAALKTEEAPAPPKPAPASEPPPEAPASNSAPAAPETNQAPPAQDNVPPADGQAPPA